MYSSTFSYKVIEHSPVIKYLQPGREPWSSGNGRRLRSEGRGFESRCHILDGHFSH